MAIERLRRDCDRAGCWSTDSRSLASCWRTTYLRCRNADNSPRFRRRVRVRTRQEDPAERSPLRKPGEGTSLPGWLGSTLGGYADPRHYETTSRAHVRRRETGTAATADRTLPLLPVRRPHGSSGRLCGSRGRLLQRTPGLDRTLDQSAVGRLAGSSPRPQKRATAARTHTPEAWLVPH